MEFSKSIFITINYLFFFYTIIYVISLFIATISGAIVLEKKQKEERFRNKLLKIKGENCLPISILVPAYNEEITIVKTLESLIHLDYKGDLEIIVIDDGSQDNMLKVLLGTFDFKKVNKPIRMKIPCSKVINVYECVIKNIEIILIQKENGGKADALNLGVNASKFPYVITMDADSVLQKDAVTKITNAVLENENVIACGGLIQISNGIELKYGEVKSAKLPKKRLVLLQMLEYSRVFQGSRVLFNQFNGNLIISGAFSLFKKSLILTVGGFNTDTLGEDMEMVIKLHVFCRTNHIPYKMDYAPDAVCWTQAPEEIGELKKQRRRWHIGLFQSLINYREILLDPRFGLIGSISFVYYLIFELLSPFIELIGLITIIFGYFLEILNVQFMIFYFAIYILFGAIITITGFFTSVYTVSVRYSLREWVKICIYCFIESFGFRQLITSFRLSVFINYKKNKEVWGKQKRSL